ncbi:MAG: hypothetical protein AAB400_03630 [Patescibacteria group bacterium]
MFRESISFVLYFLCALIGIFLSSAIGAPFVLDAYQSLQKSTLPFEGELRIYLLIIGIAFFLVWGVWLVARKRIAHIPSLMLYAIFFISFLLASVVFIGDTSHRLMEEFSWIRYSTALFLLGASLCAAFLVRIYHGTQDAARFPLMCFWGLMSASFFFAAADEIFEIHEKLGRFIQAVVHYPSEVTDYITLAYAVVALVIVALSFRFFLTEYSKRHSAFRLIMIVGVILYFLSTIFDTVDISIHRSLRSLANLLSSNPDFFFSDQWAVFWSPRNFLNGIEEVFEQAAATTFFTALLTLVLEKTGRIPISVNFQIRTSMKLAIGAATFIGVLLFGYILFKSSNSVVAFPYIPTTQIASWKEGLFHTDDVFYHPSWGVLVANEGGNTVLLLRDGIIERIPDPKKVVHDPDSLTATKDAVYVSDGSESTIFRYTRKDGWNSAWSKKDGLVHPEALVAVDSTLYVLDESQKSITKLAQGKSSVIWKPEHADWKAPESIAYDSTSKRLYVSDDVSGALFRIEFGKSVEKISQLKSIEDITVLPGGSLLATNSSERSVVEITPDGKTQRRLLFRRPYRDLQGITIDEQGTAYVVTANGFDSTSFMPSFLWSIPSL